MTLAQLHAAAAFCLAVAAMLIMGALDRQRMACARFRTVRILISLPLPLTGAAGAIAVAPSR